MIDKVKGCFATTDWNLFIETSQSLDELCDVVNSYLTFCENNIVSTKRVKCYGNNKPWITKELKALLKEKKKAYQTGNNEDKHRIQRQLKNKIKDKKKQFKVKIESKLKANDTKQVWRDMK